MKRRLLARSVLLLPLSLFFVGCASNKGKDSLKRVDDVVGRIERVYVECELANQRAQEAVDTLHAIADPGFEGDPLAAYAGFVESVERAEKQAEALQSHLDPMKEAAEKLFARWSQDLDSFTNLRLRQVSQARLAETRARYQAILTAVEPAQAGFDALNKNLRDTALFLGHDFNPSSLDAIRADVSSLMELAAQLDEGFTNSRDRAQEYVKAASLSDRIEMSASAEGGS